MVSSLKQTGVNLIFGQTVNSINFDEEIIRKTFFKTLFNAYVTQLEGNKRGDILNVIRSFHNYDNTYLKTTINSKGNSSFKLEDLSKENQTAKKKIEPGPQRAAGILGTDSSPARARVRSAVSGTAHEESGHMPSNCNMQ